MKLVIDFPGLPREHIPAIEAALHLAGFDATVIGTLGEHGRFVDKGDRPLYRIEPMEGRK